MASITMKDYRKDLELAAKRQKSCVEKLVSKIDNVTEHGTKVVSFMVEDIKGRNERYINPAK